MLQLSRALSKDYCRGPDLESVPRMPLKQMKPVRLASLIACLTALPESLHAQAGRGEAVNWSRAATPFSRLPMPIPKSGPGALHLQILLDRAHFSPGVIDGAWGRNAARALAFFASPSTKGRFSGGTPELPTTIDKATYDRLRSAGGDGPVFVRYRVTHSDVAGPFTAIPALVYDQAKLRCLCYSSPLEALSEKFHVTEKLLAELNPRVNLARVTAGTELTVPNVLSENVASSMDTVIVAKIIISKSGAWTHAVDADGNLLAHYPSTLGAGYDPSPTGKFKVTHVARDPAFRYQPKLFAEVPDDEPEALLKPGPNSPVGRVWMSLSKPHYGIHGTSSPHTIGYASSHGCVRLTNWDVLQLSDLVEPGTPVEFH